MQLHFFLLAALCLAALAASQDAAENGPTAGNSPTAATTMTSRSTSRKPKGGGRCKNVTCDRTVLEECERPVVFAPDECCPVCPMTDVCDNVECGENETCSEQGGLPVCCTVRKKSTRKARQFRHRLEGKRNCTRRTGGKPGVKRGPCANATCLDNEVCIGVRKIAFCCEKQENRAALPPCNDTDIIAPITVLALCHIPGTEPPEAPPRKPGPGNRPGGRRRHCHCRTRHGHPKHELDGDENRRWREGRRRGGKDSRRGGEDGRRGGFRGDEKGHRGFENGPNDALEKNPNGGFENGPKSGFKDGHRNKSRSGDETRYNNRRGRDPHRRGQGPRDHGPMRRNKSGDSDTDPDNRLPAGDFVDHYGGGHGGFGGSEHRGGFGRGGFGRSKRFAREDEPQEGSQRQPCRCGRLAAMRLRHSLRKLSHVLRQCRAADSE